MPAGPRRETPTPTRRCRPSSRGRCRARRHGIQASAPTSERGAGLVRLEGARTVGVLLYGYELEASTLVIGPRWSLSGGGWFLVRRLNALPWGELATHPRSAAVALGFPGARTRRTWRALNVREGCTDFHSPQSHRPPTGLSIHPRNSTTPREILATKPRRPGNPRRSTPITPLLASPCACPVNEPERGSATVVEGAPAGTPFLSRHRSQGPTILDSYV